MERIISDEEKIQRAIQISQRRNKNYAIQRTAKVNVNNKKNYGLFKKMILQIIICLLIYFIFYLITTTNYIFSEDVIKQTSSILSYDINFYELYQKGLNEIKRFINNNQGENNNVSNTELTNNVTNEEKNLEKITTEEQVTSTTQMEQDATTVKKLCDFELPLQGTVTSGFRRKRSNFTNYVRRP